jgi:hypothetical protein
MDQQQNRKWCDLFGSGNEYKTWTDCINSFEFVVTESGTNGSQWRMGRGRWMTSADRRTNLRRVGTKVTWDFVKKLREVAKVWSSEWFGEEIRVWNWLTRSDMQIGFVNDKTFKYNVIDLNQFERFKTLTIKSTNERGILRLFDHVKLTSCKYQVSRLRSSQSRLNQVLELSWFVFEIVNRI